MGTFRTSPAPPARTFPGRRYGTRSAAPAPAPRVSLEPLADKITGARNTISVAQAERALADARERAARDANEAAFRARRRSVIGDFEAYCERRGGAPNSAFRHLDAELWRLRYTEIRPMLDALSEKIAAAKANFDAPTMRRLEAEHSYRERWLMFDLDGRPSKPERAPEAGPAARSHGFMPTWPGCD